MSEIDAGTTLGELVLEEPGRAALFESLGFDYCCGGARSLADACAQRGLDVHTVLELLRVYRPADASSEHAYDFRRATTAELCDHIVAAHHERLRRELPQLADTLATVVRVHGGDDPSLNDVARVFAGLRAELETHMEQEERALFPACRTLEEAGLEPAEAEALLGELEDEHAEVGDALVVLRDLAGDYRLERARCSTHRRLLEGLHELERDLHQHIHEENNVLFPRVRERLAAA